SSAVPAPRAATPPPRCRDPRRVRDASFDHLVGEREQLWRNIEAECLGRLEIDGQFKLRGLRHRQAGWLLALEDARGMTPHQTVEIGHIGAVTDKAAGRGEIATAIDRRYRMPVRRGDERLTPRDE